MTAVVPDLDLPESVAVGARGFRWSANLVVGLCLFLAATAIAMLSPLFLTGAAETLTEDTHLGPSPEHWLGTDAFGRDRLARTLVATQLTLMMASAATLISTVVGVAAGMSIWMAPRRVRNASLRVLEIAVAYPSLLITLVIAAILGTGSMQVVVAVGIAGIPGHARITANLTASVVNRDYVRIARLLGVPTRLVMTRHVLPSISEPLLILVAAGFAGALIEISGLSFIGIGVQPPNYDLGALLSSALPSLYTTPIEVVGPAMMIVVIALGAMMIGDGLAAAADPRSRAASTTATHTRLVRRTRTRVSTGSSGKASGFEGPLVEVRDLTVSRGDGLPLVRGVSFHIRQGEILGVVGESGSGKSLTAMALAQLLPEELRADASELRVAAMDLTGAVEPRSLATEIAMVYQDPGSTFNPALRMRNQLTEVLTTHRGYRKARAVDTIVGSLRALHVTAPERVVRQRPFELSGGMRQRAMIAAALVTEPRLIIADEPTTALDVTVQAEILREFRRINRDNGTSMLFVSHDIAVVEALCDRVLVMRHGQILETLTAHQLRSGEVSTEYARTLLAATPRLYGERLPA